MSSVDELESLTSLGEKLGYAGVELRKWVTEQMKIADEKSKADLEREIRRLERQTQQDEIVAKARLEVEERQAKQQAEDKQKQQQFEQQKLHRKAKLQVICAQWKIVKHRSNLDIRKYFFSERVVDRWNNNWIKETLTVEVLMVSRTN